ncbi:hypothetical protein [Nocardiopsis sp. FIRDI 009]|uniref:hypothetical protein n=1 Tax=Nocardiopsis sp. FIRDI 009 TaxID=714197 RepID=UPI000E24D0DC|nr:hypothetical protein [Nocardiopsis sp. FIRDI 009]
MQKVNKIRNIRLAGAAGFAALLPCALFGSGAFTAWLGARAAWLLLPAAFGVPFAFPRLGPPAVGQPTWNHLAELLAVAALSGVTGWWTHRALNRRPGADSARFLLSVWAAVLLGLVAAGVLRAAADALAGGVGPVAVFGFALSGALGGLLWGVCAGWVCALPVALVHRVTTARGVAAPTGA